MNNVTRKNNSKNNTFISSIIMDSIIKKKNSIYYSNLIYPSILLGTSNDLNEFSPKSLSDNSQNCDTPNSCEKKEKKIVDAPILKSLSAKNIYDVNSDDFLVISNLILLSKLEPNQKLFINYKENKNKFSKISFELKIDDSYIQKLSRWYYSQSRNETILALQKLFEVSIQQFNFHKDIKNNVEIKKYFDLFKNSLLGLNNLKITYSKDQEILKEIDIIIEKLENIINIE